MITQFYFAMGSAIHDQPRGKKESHSVSSPVIISCVIKPEDKTQPSDVFTLS